MSGAMAFFRRNALHFAMGVLFIIVAIIGLYLWDEEALPIWLSGAISYCF